MQTCKRCGIVTRVASQQNSIFFCEACTLLDIRLDIKPLKIGSIVMFVAEGPNSTYPASFDKYKRRLYRFDRIKERFTDRVFVGWFTDILTGERASFNMDYANCVDPQYVVRYRYNGGPIQN